MLFRSGTVLWWDVGAVVGCGGCAVLGCGACGGLWGMRWAVLGCSRLWGMRWAVGAVVSYGGYGGLWRAVGVVLSCGGSLCAEQIKRVNGGGSQLVSWRVRVGVFGCLLLPKSSHALPRAMGAALSLEAFTNCVDVALRNVV